MLTIVNKHTLGNFRRCTPFSSKMVLTVSPNPTKIFKHKFYATLIFNIRALEAVAICFKNAAY